MKTYDNLSKAEREKLSLFLQYLNGEKTRATIIICCSFVFVAVGMPIFMLTTIPIGMITGLYCCFDGILFMLIALANLLVFRKNMFLIFGYQNSFEYVFGITKADIKKVKATKEVKWNWKKEE